MSLVVDVEIESTDTAVKRCTQALIDCGTTSCFIDIKWAKLNNVPTRPLAKPILVYNVNGTANNAGAITDIANIILHYANHSEHTQLAVVVNGVLLPSIALNCLPGCCTRMFSCSGILD
jgi:hypothetical protein